MKIVYYTNIDNGKIIKYEIISKDEENEHIKQGVEKHNNREDRLYNAHFIELEDDSFTAYVVMKRDEYLNTLKRNVRDIEDQFWDILGGISSLDSRIQNVFYDVKKLTWWENE